MPEDLKLNGKEEILDRPLNLSDLLKQKDINPDITVVEHNMEIIPKDNYSNIFLQDKDKLEILKLVGGG